VGNLEGTYPWVDDMIHSGVCQTTRETQIPADHTNFRRNYCEMTERLS